MLTPLLKDLEKIGGQKSNLNTDAKVLDLMERISQIPGGIDLLVERYSSSSNPIIVRTLSFLLAGMADTPTAQTVSLIFSFIEMLRYWNDESTQINTLTAIQRLLMAGFPLNLLSKYSSTLFRFLIQCLERSVLVKHGAIAVLSLLYENGFLSEFEPSQISSLRDMLIRISNQHDDLLDREMQGLRGFLEDVQP